MGMTVVWALEQNKFDEADVSWCRGLGVEIQVNPLYSNVYVHSQLVKQVCNGLRIRLTTTCERQETMLKLKYGSRLIEVQRSINLSYDERQQLGF